jgi:hypothetical protein
MNDLLDSIDSTFYGVNTDRVPPCYSADSFSLQYCIIACQILTELSPSEGYDTIPYEVD